MPICHICYIDYISLKYSCMLKKILKILRFKFWCIFPKNRKSVNFIDENLNNSLEQLRPDLTGSSFPKKIVNINTKYDLQIIIPAFNAEKYIKTCIDSLLKQKTHFTYQIVIVEDGSTDGTFDIISKFDSENIKIIHQDNQGAASARNAGLNEINSNFIAFVDADDFVSEFFVEYIVATFKKTNADIIQFNFCSSENLLTKSKCKVNKISNKKLSGYMWNHAYKSEYFRNLVFPINNVFEDTINQLILFPQSKKVYCINNCLYYYRDNINGITHAVKRTNKMIDSFYITRKILLERKPFLDRYVFFIKKQILFDAVRIKTLSAEIQILYFLELNLLIKNVFSNKQIKRNKLLYYISEKKYNLFWLYVRTFFK